MKPCPRPARMGASVVEGGVCLAVFSRHGSRVLVSSFDEAGDAETGCFALPCREGDIHFGLLEGASAGLRYGLRVEGPWQPERGHRFDPAKLLVDPYATLIDRPFRWDPELARQGADTAALVPRSIVQPGLAACEPSSTSAPSFIYELGVRSFTMQQPGTPEKLRGTLAALCEPAAIDHLKRLGVSHVELMPVAAWMDERHLSTLGLTNAWGYNPVGFMALDPRLAPGGPADLAALCAAYSQAGIGVILDIVLNHTAESDEFGATISLRGLDNAVYYRHAADDPGRLINDTGCGHTLALDRAPVVRLAMDSLRHLLRLGVSGFRFDLGTVMGRTATDFTRDAPLFAAMLQDPEIARAILIAEPWDIGPGGYRLGQFPAPFAEWNGRFRDDVRKFWRGDHGMAGALATRLAGSADLFAGEHRGPRAGISFLAAHDGFTLADLVSYERKHNEANGEDNRDGDNDSHSWNGGAEGPSDDAAINAARRRDIRALLATLFLSRGVPMLTAGDELGRTQHGNNNAYAQDNPAFWLDWVHADEAQAAFVAELAALRRQHPLLAADNFLTGTGEPPDAQWLKTDATPVADHEWAGLDAFCLVLTDARALSDQPLTADRSEFAPRGDVALSDQLLTADRSEFAQRKDVVLSDQPLTADRSEFAHRDECAGESLLIAVNRSGHATSVTFPVGEWERLISSDGGSGNALPARSVVLWRQI